MQAALDSKRSWTIAGAAFLVNVVVFGISMSFGVFFDAMADEFNTGRGATSLVFALTMFTYFALGIVTGPASDRFGPRWLIAAGAVLVPGGLLLTAAAPNIWVGYVTYGIGFGTGIACVKVPVLAATGGWFDRGRATALGIVMTGIAVGTMIASPLSAALIEEIGFRQTYVVYAIVAFVTLAMAAAVVERPPVASSQRATGGVVADARELARDPSFARLYLAGVLMSMVIFVPVAFLTSYATDQGASHIEAATLVGGVGAASIFGRLGVGWIVARSEIVSVYRTSHAFVAAAMLVWLAADGQIVVLWTFALFFGVAYGAWVALLPAVTSQLFGAERLGSTLGIVFTAGAVGALAGVPLTGVVIDATGQYETAIALAGGLAVVSWLIVRPVGEQRPAAADDAVRLPA